MKNIIIKFLNFILILINFNFLYSQHLVGYHENQEIGKIVIAQDLFNSREFEILGIGNNVVYIYNSTSSVPLHTLSIDNPKPYNVTYAEVIDLDNDKKNELILFNFVRGKIYIYQNSNNFSITSTINFNNSGNFLISSVSSADLNGDRFSDLLICQKTLENCGEAFIYFGRTDLNELSSNLIIYSYPGYFGFSCSTIGDINNDHISDFAIGAYTAGDNKQGAVYIFYGSTQLDNQPDVILWGNYPNGSFGYSIASPGDLNQDGFSDILIGAPTSGDNQAGQAFVYFGGAPMDTIPDIALTGENTDDFFGGSLTTCYREDHPGCSDFMVSSYANDENGESAGKVYAYEGKIPFSGKPVATWTGEAAGDCFGYGLAAGYGVTGEDGWFWLVGAPYNDEGAEDAGKIYILPASSVALTISGNVFYRETNFGIPNVQINITEINKQFSSDSSGRFQISSIKKSGNYTAIPQISITQDISNGSIMMYDAALAAQAAAGKIELKSYQQISADANQDSAITMYDASLIAQTAMEMAKREDSHVNEWLFDPSFKKYNNLEKTQTNQNFQGILIGDVDGNWQPKKILLKSNEIQAPNFITSSLDKDHELILTITKLIHDDLIAAEVVIDYDQTELKLNKTTLTEYTRNFNLFQKDSEGKSHIGIYSSEPLGNDGALLTLRFDIIKKELNTVEINISNYLENGGIPGKYKYSINLSELNLIPKSLELSQNFPNPFNSNTIIKFGLPKSEKVTVHIYNVLGERVASLYDNQLIEAGYHQVVWDGLNHNSAQVSSGVYFCELLIQNQRQLRKMLYVR